MPLLSGVPTWLRILSYCMEDTQKFALKVCTKKWDENYKTLLTMCNINTLAMRRSIVRLCLLFKIISGDMSYPNLPFTIRVQPYQLRHLNTTQLSVPFAISNNFKSSFFLDTISAWNQLGFDRDGISLVFFKNQLL